MEWPARLPPVGGGGVSGVIELNKMTAILAKLDAIMHKLGNLEKRLHYDHEI